MPRAAPPTGTLLGKAIPDRRAGPQDGAAAELGLSGVTLSRLERGTHHPSAHTALKLARWLGWTMEEVMAAADQSAPTSDTPSQER